MKSDGDRAANVSRRMGEGIKGGLDAIGGVETRSES